MAFGFALLLFNSANAQIITTSNKVVKKIASKTMLAFESRKIVPHTVIIYNYDSSFYRIDYTNNIINWLKPLNTDSVLIEYRYFNFKINENAYRYNYDSVKNNFIAAPAVISKSKQNENIGLFGQTKSINYNGSFGRNLSFGNNQDAVFNSQLNLQISGMLGDSIEIAAAITDDNIPIQPDGTTQQLNEFDKILLQFKKRNMQLDLGDIDVRSNQYYFLNFYKRLQGASYKSLNSKNNSNFSFAGAIAKGKFARNIFNGLEGNQGPYKLEGNNNEFFLIILAGTERVFMDGEMLQRGEDQDYIINYNTAEIVFTPKHMITKDKRIQVEFEYADRNYLNYLVYAAKEMKVNKNLQINIAAYSNNDAKNSPINQQLNANQKQFLNSLGDSIEQAFYHSAILDSFSNTKILYAKRVNPINALWDSIYVYSTHADSAKYYLNFIEIGINKGNYIPLFNSANGRVFQYIAPVNGVKQGNFEPAIFLVTPKKQQIFTANAIYNINRKTILITDVALSNYDVNTFSSKNKNDNIGFAAKFLLQNNNTFHNKYQLQTKIGYEWVNEKFKPIERLRTVEFARDWGLPLITSVATEHLPQISLELNNLNNNNKIQLTTNGYLRSDKYHAIKNQISLYQYQPKNAITIKLNSSLVNIVTPNSKGYFVKINSEVSRVLKQINNYEIGFNYSLERNLQSNKFISSLEPISFSFENIGAFIKSNERKNNQWAFHFFTRKNELPFQSQLLQTDRSNNYNFSLHLLNNHNHQLKFNATYRQLFVQNNFLTNLQPDKTLLSRTEYKVNEWNGFLTGFVLYELGTGQEQKRDFTYIEVPAGRGEYTWNDYNLDGIPQLNEFEIALYPDLAKYIRIFTPTNQFVKASYLQFNYNLQITPKAIMAKFRNEKFKKFISKFILQSSLQTSQKVIADNKIQFNPFKKNITDTTLIHIQQQLSNTISFNRYSNIWGIDVSNFQNKSKALLTYGFESRWMNEWLVKTRINFKKVYTLELLNKFSTTSLITPSFNNRNYNIKSFSVEPKLTYTYLTRYRLQLSYIFVQKENNIIYGGEKAINNIIQAEAKLNIFNNTSLLTKFSMQHINFNGNTGTTTSYILLDALLPGKNYLWMVELTKRLGNNLELNINYEGRKPASSKMIHIGRAGIRALL